MQSPNVIIIPHSKRNPESLDACIIIKFMSKNKNSVSSLHEMFEARRKWTYRSSKEDPVCKTANMIIDVSASVQILVILATGGSVHTFRNLKLPLELLMASKIPERASEGLVGVLLGLFLEATDEDTGNVLGLGARLALPLIGRSWTESTMGGGGGGTEPVSFLIPLVMAGVSCIFTLETFRGFSTSLIIKGLVVDVTAGVDCCCC